MADLSGVFEAAGILTPSEKIKQQQALQQQQYQNQMAQVAAAQQQQQINAQLGQLSEGFGYSTYLAEQGVGKLKQGLGQSRPPQAPVGDQGMAADQKAADGVLGGVFGKQPPPGGVVGNDLPSQGGISGNLPKTDTMSGKFRQIARVFAQQGDPQRAMAFEIEARKAEQTEAEEARKIEAEARAKAVETRAQAAAGNPGNTYSYRQPNGDIVTARDLFDEIGNYTGREVIGGGPNRQENQNFDDPRTASQRGEELVNFQKLVSSTELTNKNIDSIIGGIESGSKTGLVREGVALADTVYQTISQTVSMLGGVSPEAQSETTKMFRSSEWQKLVQKTGITESQFQSLIYAKAKANNPSGQVNAKDVKDAASQVGANITNPKTVVSILKDLRRRSDAEVDTAYKYIYDPASQQNAKSLYDRYKAGFKPSAPAAGAGADDAAYQEWKRSRGLE